MMQPSDHNSQARLALWWSIQAAVETKESEQAQAREARNEALSAILGRLEAARRDAGLVDHMRREMAPELS